MSDHKGARIVLNALPKADCLIADKGYDSTWFRQELLARGISFRPGEKGVRRNASGRQDIDDHDKAEKPRPILIVRETTAKTFSTFSIN
jgi:IS5 family transposase